MQSNTQCSLKRSEHRASRQSHSDTRSKHRRSTLGILLPSRATDFGKSKQRQAKQQQQNISPSLYIHLPLFPRSHNPKMALILHPTALSLGTPTPQSPLPLSVAPLPLPSRFPSSVAPRAAVGANIFVFAPGRPVVWEYDGRGRRLSEMSIGGVEEVAVLSSGVAVLTAEGVKVMRRAGKKWEVARILQVGGAFVAVLIAGSAGRRVYGRRGEDARARWTGGVGL